MRTNEIVHINGRYKKIDCDLIDQCHVCIRLKTGKDIRRVEVVYNDPYIRYEGSDGLVWLTCLDDWADQHLQKTAADCIDCNCNQNTGKRICRNFRKDRQ